MRFFILNQLIWITSAVVRARIEELKSEASTCDHAIMRAGSSGSIPESSIVLCQLVFSIRSLVWSSRRPGCIFSPGQGPIYNAFFVPSPSPPHLPRQLPTLRSVGANGGVLHPRRSSAASGSGTCHSSETFPGIKTILKIRE